MIDRIWMRQLVLILAFGVTFATGLAGAHDFSVVQIDRLSNDDRNAMIASGLTLIAETNDALLAVGPSAEIERAAATRALPTSVVDDEAGSGTFALVGLRPGWTESDLESCGRLIARGDDWLLLKAESFATLQCSESPGWFLRVLDLDPLQPITQPTAARAPRIMAPIPLIQEMVDQTDTGFSLAHWAALSESPNWTTRVSSSQGCVDAAGYVHNLFSNLGLVTEYQHHTNNYADNVIGTLPGITLPDQVVIAIGHLDDLPSSGLAPGADDNASGTAMVTAVAEVMSGYCFDRTVKFLAVTGEEQGLHGSDHYADTAANAGEDIQAVLNGDMIGWEGDGNPALEDLDINYNSGSQWLATAMVDAAAQYNTGIAVNAFSCPSMTYSDHSPFWDHGWSAICGITDNEGFCGQGGSYPFYHQSSDTITNCGPGAPDFEAAAIRTYLATLAHLAQPVAPIPAPPTGIDAQPDGANRIALHWSSQGQGIGYRVFRSTGICSNPGPATLIGETSVTDYVDTSASGDVPYAYTVQASAAAGCNSPASACVEAITTGECTEPPTFVGLDVVTNPATSNCRLDLNWTEPQQIWCGGPVVYNVYRSTTAGFTPTQETRIASHTSGTSFTDNGVNFDEAYSYIVRAVDLAHGGEDGNRHEVTGGPTGPTAIGTWTDDAGDSDPAKLILEDPWTVSAGAGVSGAAYATGYYGSNTCASLTSPPLLLDANPQLQFWSKYEIEDGWDKGELQISTNDGNSWTRIEMSYPGSSSNTNDSCGLGSGTFFTGHSTNYAPYTADLSSWAHNEIVLRWIFSSDGLEEDNGWWIDNITLTDVAVPSECIGGLIFMDGFESGTIEAWSN
ncbi:MAG: M28 family peptidase [bacterium]|nr:M28 family peptidase [bacterium]